MAEQNQKWQNRLKSAVLATPWHSTVYWQQTLAELLTREFEFGRPQLWLGALLMMGALGYFALPVSPPAILLYPTFIFFILLAYSLREKFILFSCMCALAASCFGFVAADLSTRMANAPKFHKALGARNVEGRVLEVEDRDEKPTRILLEVFAVENLDQSQQPKFLSLTGRKLEGVTPGQTLNVKANLQPHPLPVMPQAYDPAFVGYFASVGGIGTVSVSPQNISATVSPDVFTQARINIEQWRHHMTARIRSGIEGENGAIAASLITGDRAGLGEELYRVFNASGLMHVLSISGLHMVMVAGGFFWVLRLLLALPPFAQRHYPEKKIAAVAAIFVATLYLIISGAAVATTRSYIMILIMFLAVLLNRPALSMRNVVLAGILILLVAPETAVGASFQLSFAATAALIAAYERQWFPKIQAWGEGLLPRILALFLTMMVVTACTSLIAELATMPFTLHHFHRLNMWGLAGNVLALTFIEFLVMPAVLLTLLALPLGLEWFTLPILDFGIARMVEVAQFVASFPGALMPVAGFHVAALFICSFAIMWACFWRTKLALLALPIFVGGMIWGLHGRAPDFYLSPTGWTYAIRQQNGLLSLHAHPRERFVAARWLEADGDTRKIDDPQLASAQNCDAQSCVLHSSSLGVVALPRQLVALEEDCARADVLILRYHQAPTYCPRPKLILDETNIQTAMGVTGYFAGQGKLNLTTYHESCGDRPWCRKVVQIVDGAAQERALESVFPE